jgi:hypothetical protein
MYSVAIVPMCVLVWISHTRIASPEQLARTVEPRASERMGEQWATITPISSTFGASPVAFVL